MYDDNRGMGAMFGLMFLVVVVVAGLMVVGRISKDATARYEAKQAAVRAEAYAQQQMALYNLQQEQSRLDHKLEMAAMYESAHDQRLATLAVALAGLDKTDQAALLLAARVGRDWWMYVIAGILGIVVGVVIIKNMDRIAWYSNRVFEKLMGVRDGQDT